MKRGIYIAVPVIGAISLVTLLYFLVDRSEIDVLNPSGVIASQQRDILLFALLLSGVVVIPVFTLLIFFSVKYRKGNKKARYTPDWSENKKLEGLWWGIPILIIGILGVVTYQTSHSLDPYKALAGKEPLTVQVVALRWKWLFMYPEQGVASLNQLPIPVNTPVRFSMTADAPMSAFWIPALGSQTYAMSGMESQLNLKAAKLGEFTGYTTNINGEGYAKMTFNTKVLNEDDFKSWVTDAQQADQAMNMNEYENLAQPKSETDERTYRLANAKIFETIVNKNGGHSHMNHGAHQ